MQRITKDTDYADNEKSKSHHIELGNAAVEERWPGRANNAHSDNFTAHAMLKYYFKTVFTSFEPVNASVLTKNKIVKPTSPSNPIALTVFNTCLKRVDNSKQETTHGITKPTLWKPLRLIPLLDSNKTLWINFSVLLDAFCLCLLGTFLPDLRIRIFSISSTTRDNACNTIMQRSLPLLASAGVRVWSSGFCRFRALRSSTLTHVCERRRHNCCRKS